MGPVRVPFGYHIHALNPVKPTSFDLLLILLNSEM